MADFLTIVSTKKIKDDSPILEPSTFAKLSIHSQVASPSISPEFALEALKTEPDQETFLKIIAYLRSTAFNFYSTEPTNASIAYQLVNNGIPNYWRIYRESSQANYFINVMQNPMCLGHIITRLRALVADQKGNSKLGKISNTPEHIEDLLEIIERTLSCNDTSNVILGGILSRSKNSLQRKLIWKEYVAQVATDRILSLAAEAENAIKTSQPSWQACWVANGKLYADWLGQNIAVLLKNNGDEEHNVAVTEFCSRILSLGFNNHIVESLLSTLIGNKSSELLAALFGRLKHFERRKYLTSVIAFIVKKFSSSGIFNHDIPLQPSKIVSGLGRFLIDIIQDDDMLKEYLSTAMARSVMTPLDDSLDIRRSVMAVLAKDEGVLHTLLETCIKHFGDALYIKHTPTLQQEVLAQNLLLCCGYVHRSQPMFLTMMARSTWHIKGIAVGVAISKLVDNPELQLKFDLDGVEAVEAGWYQHLSEMKDQIGDVGDLAVRVGNETSTHRSQTGLSSVPIPSKNSVIAEIQVPPRIVEILSNSEDEDADLIPYATPDSDPEDEADPEMVNRNKPVAPVYIRDLITGLRDQEDYDRHVLALSTAAGLIRRKSDFGSEVTERLEELVTVLTGLQDNLELTDFAPQRQQALVAVLLAKPAQMAQWLGRAFFSGDYSLAQRHAMLTTLGVGARELAGIRDMETENLIPAQSSFPSKQLPPHLHQVYASTQDTDLVGRLSSNMAREMLSPIASQAADQLSGPKILQTRTFSSRMEVEKKRKKAIPNALAQIVADNFFFPLTGRWWVQVRTNSDSIYTSTHLLPPFLQTLALLLNAAGAHTLALPQMTREFWDLLLSARGLAINDKNILSGVLFGFLMILETSENKERLVDDQGKELMETQAWVKVIFDRLGAGSEEDERVRALAAGVVVRCQEVIEKYQRRMVGALLDY